MKQSDNIPQSNSNGGHTERFPGSDRVVAKPAPMPQGLQWLLARAGHDPEFRARLLAERSRVAGDLTAVERGILDAIPAEQLSLMIERLRPAVVARRMFLCAAATVALSAGLALPASSQDSGNANRSPSTNLSEVSGQATSDTITKPEAFPETNGTQWPIPQKREDMMVGGSRPDDPQVEAERRLREMEERTSAARAALAPIMAQMQATSEGFEGRLKQGHMTFTMPAGFEQATRTLDKNVHFAIRAKNADLEAWYTVRPLQPQIAAYQKRMDNPPPDVEKQVEVHPNKLHSMDFVQLLSYVGGRIEGKPVELKDDAIKEMNNTDWVAVADINTTDSRFAAGFTYCSIVALHVDDKADAYIFVLFNDPEKAKKVWSNAAEALRFEK
jgi:hypothetical protein